METLANLECFVRSAETGGFSAAARRLALTPAAVSRNVAMLERNLGVRLFQRSTRKLTLTEDGERFLVSIRSHLDSLQSAVAAVASDRAEPAGILKLSLSPNFGVSYILPLLPEFLARHPAIRMDWSFENRPADLIADGFDAAIGGGFDLPPGMVSRTLTAAHIILVAAPDYLRGRRLPEDPSGLGALDGIVMRSVRSGRIRQWVMQDESGNAAAATLNERIVLDDPAAMIQAAVLGLGVTVVTMPDALPYLEDGRLVRLLPQWHAELGPISIYYASRALLPAKTRVFIDFVTDAFRKQRLAERFAANRR